MNETIEINGKKYSIKDPNLITDGISGNLILKSTALAITSVLSLNRESGYEGPLETVLTDESRITEYTLTDKIHILKSRYGEVFILPNPATKGNGRLYPSTSDEFNTFYDDYTNPRQNVHNKFRPFDNQVSLFKDIHNKLIHDVDRKKLIHRNYDFGVDSPTYKITEGKQYTFGVELETSSGKLTNDDVIGLNLKCEFDGSLRDTPDQRKEDVLGGEYITGVLKGDKGFYQLQRICNKLSEKCTINGKCGVHVHVGNISFNKESIIYMYKLGEILQDEFYAMLPKSRRENTYCRKIKNLSVDLQTLNSTSTALGYTLLLDEYYHKIYQEVAHNKDLPNKRSNKSTNHPMGSKCGYDKHTQRYCWLNFVTAMFNTKGNPEAMTIEFRSHSATLNYQKVKNWVKICMAFVAFAENHKASIRRGYWLDVNKQEYPINIETILKATYPNSHKLLTRYVESRKEKFFSDTGSIEEQEYKTDKEGINYKTLKEDILCV